MYCCNVIRRIRKDRRVRSVDQKGCCVGKSRWKLWFVDPVRSRPVWAPKMYGPPATLFALDRWKIVKKCNLLIVDDSFGVITCWLLHSRSQERKLAKGTSRASSRQGLHDCVGWCCRSPRISRSTRSMRAIRTCALLSQQGAIKRIYG